MMTVRRWGKDEDDVLRKLVDSGLSITASAKTMGWAKQTVISHAQQLGLQWNRTRVVEATTARIVDAKARRAVLRQDLLSDLERLRKKVWQPALVYNFGGSANTFESEVLDEPPIADQLKLIQAVSTGVTTLEKLDRMDADDGLVGVVGVLDRIARAITAAAETTPEQDIL
jgi:hypothetical protein